MLRGQCVSITTVFFNIRTWKSHSLTSCLGLIRVDWVDWVDFWVDWPWVDSYLLHPHIITDAESLATRIRITSRVF